MVAFFFFFFKQKTAYEITASDWSSDVCSSDLLRARAWPAFEAIIGAHAGESVAIVAHGGTNRALLCTALGLELRRLLALGQDYGALSVLARVAAGWRLVRLNELPML